MQTNPASAPGAGPDQPARPKRVLLALAWYSEKIRAGVARYAGQAGWVLDPSAAHGLSQQAASARVLQPDGVLTIGASARPVSAMIRSLRCPIVELSDTRVRRKVARAVPDTRAQGRLAVRHLADRGYRRFAFVRKYTSSIATGRFVGAAEAAEAVGGELIDLYWQRHARRRKLPAGAMFDWLVRRVGELPSPAAIIAVSDDLAVAILDACDAAGVAVPEQAAVVGFDNDEITCRHARVPLSSVDTNLEELGYRGAALLGRLMAGAARPAEPLLVPPAGFVERRSTSLTAIAHREVAVAVRYILDHFQRAELDVAEVARATGLSRRGLNKAFSKHLGRSAGQEIERLRLRQARRLLETTALSATEIAARCGLGSLIQLRRTLRRHTGLTPREYRRAAAMNGQGGQGGRSPLLTPEV